MRLISAEDAITELDKLGMVAQQRTDREIIPGKIDFGKGLMMGLAMASTYIQEKVSTAYDVDKIIEQLEEREMSYADFESYVNDYSTCLDTDYDDTFSRGIERAIKIIKAGGINEK